MKKQIVDLAMNNADIRDTAWTLHISINAVVLTLKLSPRCVAKLPLDNPLIQLICEVDEMWSFVGNKKQQRWLWYAWESRFKRIVGLRKRFAELLKLVSGFNVAFWCTNNFSVYDVLTNENHITGKLYTQLIERENLNRCNRLKRLSRKTLGYSKSAEMHDKIIGTLIEREHYAL